MVKQHKYYMKIIIVGTGRFIETTSGKEQEILEIRAGEISLARIHGSSVLVGNALIFARTIPEAIAKAAGCTAQEAAAAISEYSETAS